MASATQTIKDFTVLTHYPDAERILLLMQVAMDKGNMFNIWSLKELVFLQCSVKGISCIYFHTILKSNVQFRTK
jgi:hypothetical protein